MTNINRSSLMEELFGSDSEENHTAPLNLDDEISSSFNNIVNVDIGPQNGDIYDHIDSLFQAYQEHAKHKGFSVVKRAVRKNKYALITCERGGKAEEQNSSKRIGCPARINAIKKDDGSWVVSTTCSTHNHELDPHMSILMPAHRSMSINMKKQLEANDIAGIRPCKNVRLMEVQAGGPQNLGCLPKYSRNFIESQRRLRLGDGDADAIRKLFIRLQQRYGNFFHLMDIDDEWRLRNFMWIHPRCKVAYEDFHDVMSFDTTYLVNQYKMPFAIFVGINHHGQSILFGCALVTQEDSNSFKWLFSNWLEAMGGIHPTAIIIDQCESIKIALREVMPNTIHRFCLWHIMSKLPQKFRGVVEFDKAINEFKGIVYDSITIKIFELKLGEFLVKYGLERNEWLKDLSNQKKSWVPVYLNHMFWAGMISTQRSEGMHAYFDGYLHSRTTLKQFVEQYEIATSNKVQKEFLADFESKNKVIKCLTEFGWEKQFRRVYTNSIFKWIQDEIKRMWYCRIIPQTREEEIKAANEVGIEKYKVLEKSILNNYFHKEFTYIVEYRPMGDYLSCQCKKF